MFVCKHFIQTKLAYELRVKEHHPEEWKEFLRGHPFTGGHGTCQFLATFTKNANRRKKFKGSSTDESFTSSTWQLLPGKTLLQHSSNCPGVGKIKARQLTANPGFRNQVVVNGKASSVELTRYILLQFVWCVFLDLP